MTLTRKQQRVAFNLIVSSIIAVVFGLVCWAITTDHGGSKGVDVKEHGC